MRLRVSLSQSYNFVESIGTPSPEKEEGRVVGKSPSSGKISIIQPPISAVPRTTTTASREPSTTSSKPSITSSYRNDQFNHGIRKELKHQEIEIEDNLSNYKIGTKYQNHIDNDDFDDGEDYVEISLKEKHLQDLINFGFVHMQVSSCLLKLPLQVGRPP